MNTPADSSTPAPAHTLAQALTQVRAQLAQAQPPAALQARVLAALPVSPPLTTAQTRAQQYHAWLQERVLNWLVAGGRVRTARIAVLALSAGALAGGSALLLGQAAHTGARMASAQRQQATTGFMPLVSPAQLNAQALGWLVPTDVPRAQLAGLGLPYDPASVGGTVRAELLMNPAGEVLAVRLME